MTLSTIFFLFSPTLAQNTQNYPRDAVKAFLESCTGLHEERFHACVCIIREFQALMPFEQFVSLARSPNVTRNNRFTTVAGNCGRRHSNKEQ